MVSHAVGVAGGEVFFNAPGAIVTIGAGALLEVGVTA